MSKCPGKDCGVEVERPRFLCRPHWYSVPKPLRDRIWQLYREAPGSEELESIEHPAARFRRLEWNQMPGELVEPVAVAE